MNTTLQQGLSLHQAGNPAAAIPLYEQFLATTPNHDPTLYNLALAHLQLGHPAKAIPHFQRVTELAPHYLLAHANLGYAHLLLDNLDEAITSLQTAIALDPNISKLHLHLGHAHKARAELPEALAAYRRAIALDPGGGDPAPQSSLLYTLYYHEDSTPESIYAEHAAWATEPVASAPAHVRDPIPGGRLRIAYLGANFNNHCQSLFTLPLLKNHDRTQFEITIYSNTARPDAITDQLRQHAHHFHDITQLTDAQLVQKIRADQIDLLIDLTMHMADNRLRALALKPAPIQITWLAYPGTTGLPQIDYRLTDPHLDPPDQPTPAASAGAGQCVHIYSETSLHLPHTFWCYDPLTTEPLVNPLPALESGRGGGAAISFGCLNNFCKITPPTLAVWSQVLYALPDSRLHLLAPEGTARTRITHALQIDPTRITFHSRRPRPDYLALYHHIDIALDTCPYNGHTTSLDAYWMGVPVITLAGGGGATAVSRAGLSQLTNLNLTDLIAHTPQQFVEIAKSLAADLPRLANLRSTLRQRMQNSPLMNAPLFAKNLESLYEKIWHAHQDVTNPEFHNS